MSHGLSVVYIVAFGKHLLEDAPRFLSSSFLRDGWRCHVGRVGYVPRQSLFRPQLKLRQLGFRPLLDLFCFAERVLVVVFVVHFGP